MHSDKSKLIYFRLVPKQTAEDLPASLGKSQSFFQKFLSKLDPQKSHILFTVFPDSFDAYLEARKILSQREFPLDGVQAVLNPLLGNITLTRLQTEDPSYQSLSLRNLSHH